MHHPLSPTTMRAIRLHAFGGPEALQLDTVPLPQPGPGEVLVRVEAAAVNPADWKVRAGSGVSSLAGPMPLIPGWDLAGSVVSLGEGVRAFVIGQRVYGMVNFPKSGQAYAQFTAVPAAHLAPIPEALSFDEAAALPLAALTAWQALVEAGQVGPGQRVLIHAAAGGVGHLAVQIAKVRGAHVIGTASAANAAFVKGLGADEVVDYTAGPFESRIAPVDLVFDAVGGEVLRRSFGLLKSGGRLISIVVREVQALAAEAGLPEGAAAPWLLVRPEVSHLRALSELVEQGRLRVEVGRTFPLSEAAEAHRLSETRHLRGKLVLKPWA